MYVNVLLVHFKDLPNLYYRFLCGTDIQEICASFVVSQSSSILQTCYPSTN